MTTTLPEMAALKARLKATRMAGDDGHLVTYLEPLASLKSLANTSLHLPYGFAWVKLLVQTVTLTGVIHSIIVTIG